LDTYWITYSLRRQDEGSQYKGKTEGYMSRTDSFTEMMSIFPIPC